MKEEVESIAETTPLETLGHGLMRTSEAWVANASKSRVRRTTLKAVDLLSDQQLASLSSRPGGSPQDIRQMLSGLVVFSADEDVTDIARRVLSTISMVDRSRSQIVALSQLIARDVPSFDLQSVFVRSVHDGGLA